MKKLNRILIVLCVLAVFATVIGIIAVADDAPAAGTVEKGQELVTAYNNATVLADKQAAMNALQDYLPSIDPGSTGYEGLSAAVAAACNDYAEASLNAYDAVKNDPSTIKLGQAYKPLHSFFMTAEWDGMDEFTDRVVAAQQDYEAKIAAAAAAVYGKGSLQEAINYPKAQYTIDFEKDPVGGPQQWASSFSGHTTGSSMPNSSQNGTDVNRYCVRQDPVTGNKYYGINYDYHKKGTDQHSYVELTFNSDGGMVMEFDLSTDDTTGGSISPGSALGPTGDRIFPVWFWLANNGFESGDGKVVLSNVIAPHEWTHFIVTLNPITGSLGVYIDYEFVGEWDHDKNNLAYIGQTPGTNTDYQLINCRLGNRVTGASWLIDNITFYNGSLPRQITKVADLQEQAENGVEKPYILYLKGILADETHSFSDRYVARAQALRYIDKYYDQQTEQFLTDDTELNEAIGYIVNKDMTEIEAEMKVANLAKLKELVDLLAASSTSAKRSINNTTQRKTLYDGANTFHDNNTFDTGSQAYVDEITRLGKLATAIDQDIAAKRFIAEVVGFTQRFTEESMDRHYQEASALYLQIDPSYVYGIAAEKADFEKALADFAGAEDVLNEVHADQAAKRIIAMMDKVKVFTTEEEWDEHYDEINPFVIAAREIINVGNYNKEYPGLDESLAIFKNVNGYFYNKLQLVHIEVIAAKLDTFVNTSSYIERMGVVSFIKNYLAANDVDLTNPTIARQIETYNVYESELDVQKTEYVDLLAQNTQRFVNTVAIMVTYDDYATIKSYYDRASEYYYSMNVSDSSVESAIGIFEEYTFKLAEIELESKLFVEAAEALSAAEGADAKYLALVECHKHAALTDASFEGAADAIELYNTELASYNEGIAPVNAELAGTADAVCSARALCKLKGIMSIIRSLLG